MENHHGQIVERIVRRNGHSITDVARLTNVNRRSVYNWFSQSRLKPEIISKIGEAINHDFSKDLPELNQQHNPHYFYDNDQKKWKTKYVELLERYNELLIKHLRNNSRIEPTD